jgi:hypothetical protein
MAVRLDNSISKYIQKIKSNMNPGKTTGSKDDRTKIRGIVADIELPQNVKTCNSTKWLTGTQGDELMCSGRVLSSYSTSGIRRVTIKHPVIKQQWGNDGIVITTSGTYPWSWSHIFSVTVNQVLATTVKFSKCRLQLKH